MVSDIFYFHLCLGKWSNLTNIFQMGWNHQLDQFHGSVMGVYTTWVFWEILYVPGWAWRVWCTFHAWKPNSHCQGKPKSAHHLFGNPRKLKMINTPKWIWMDQKWPKLWFFSLIFSDTLWIISKICEMLSDGQVDDELCTDILAESGDVS